MENPTKSLFHWDDGEDDDDEEKDKGIANNQTKIMHYTQAKWDGQELIEELLEEYRFMM